ncbi:GNAT family N-acetyltransferase [Elizabethkingia ursingii]|uniref:Acetyltransferase n=2 Tax=Elizabethkingia ursingii TaxID=1756150 RepID=A0AAJ3N9S7_9FLAO|nr:GNAT family N-acetyltransferase [Elizabethkingia ursingii]AQX08429.1 acetyltransferase [Elizabethkingia ursingii]MCL1666434.1 GNAT family N-acetyltransferase [Elizabethkingia ursingii]OPB72106.1 acetyltransferase [Elizabethkingia ursingii]OPB91243.1 acetyltransferase [Elizabethkingia ursingii]
MIKLRHATEGDLPALLEFEQGVVTAERPYNPTLIEGEIHYYNLNSLIDSENAALIVAEDEENIIASGYALIKNTEKDYYNFDRYAYLGFMYVKPEYRGKGVNKLILDELTNWSKDQGVSEIRLEVYSDNVPAVKAYEKAAFEPLILLMRKKI